MRDARSTTRRRRLPAVAGALACVCALLGLFAAAGPAGAATENAQLSLTGVVDGNNPTGGSQLGVHPGTTITFAASAAPTQKIKDLVDQIGLGSLLDALLGTVDFQVVADFSHLPGGHSNTTLTDSTKATFHFTRLGTYSFTYQAQQVSIGLLGKKIVPINLDGNQAKQVGVELNASNQYVGKIVVSKNPKNGISIQTPSIKTQPKIGGHKLPAINIPGVRTPTVPTSVPNLNPTHQHQDTHKTQKPTTKTAPQNKTSLLQRLPGTDGLLPVPARVVPDGYGGTTYGGGGGFYGASVVGSGPDYAQLQLTNSDGSTTTLGGRASSASPAAKQATDQQTADATRASKHDAAAQLPVVLAIVAIVALALVASTYARLFLLRRQQP